MPRNLAPALVRLTLQVGGGGVADGRQACVGRGRAVGVHVRVLDVLEVGFVAF